MKLATKVYENAAAEQKNQETNDGKDEKKDSKSDVEEASYEEK